MMLNDKGACCSIPPPTNHNTGEMIMGDNLPTTEGKPEQQVCKGCGCEIIPTFTLRPDTPHYAEYRCPECNRHMGWAKKPQNETARSKNKYTAKEEDIFRCQMCQRTLDMLVINEVIECHHVIAIDQGGIDEKENIWWVCTACHSEIHHRRTYMMKKQIETITISDLRSQFDEHNVPEAARAVLERIFIATQEARSL